MRGPGPILLLLLLAPALAVPARAKERDAKKEMLAKVGKLLKAGDASGISGYFRSKGKIELKLKGIKSGKYRDKQARALLTSYFKAIEPKEYTLKEVKGSYGKFKMKYRVRATGKTIEGKTYVYVERESGRWKITGIIES